MSQVVFELHAMLQIFPSLAQRSIQNVPVLLRLIPRFIIPLIGLSIMMASFLPAQAGYSNEHMHYKPFGYHGVRLDAGWMKSQVEETKALYLSLSDDDLLRGFRQRAGRPASGGALGGAATEGVANWYADGTFSIFGQIVSGLSRLYAATDDAACREKVDRLVHEWGQCIGPYGYFYWANPNTPHYVNAPHYIYDKMVCGLLDAYIYCGNREALGFLNRITDWAIQNLERYGQMEIIPQGAGPTEWYTLSENLYRAYLITGDAKYRDFAKVWEFAAFWHRFDETPTRIDPVHAYSHVNSLCGLGAAYLATGEDHYLNTLEKAYDYLQENQVFATGGFGPGEGLVPRSDLVASLRRGHSHFETQCGSWAIFKLAKYLITSTGDARYGDWAEKALYNGVGASIPGDREGHVMYFSDYGAQGGSKEFRNDIRWSCCTGTRPMAVADYSDLIYFQSPDGIAVNLFAPSNVCWSQNGTTVTLRQQTKFPEEGQVDITMHIGKPCAFTLRLRAAKWLDGPMGISVGGKPVVATVGAKNWVEVHREWTDGDRVTLSLPMDFKVSRLQEDAPSAVLRGPVAMAFCSDSNRNPAGLVDFAHFPQHLAPIPGQSMSFALANHPDFALRPFYSFRKGERYFLYVDNALPKGLPDSDLLFKPDWSRSEIWFTNKIGATVECQFEGNGIEWHGFLFPDAGVASVTMDGVRAEEVDQYGPEPKSPFVWKSKKLPDGRHTIRIEVLDKRNPKSSGNYVNLDYLGLKKAN